MFLIDENIAGALGGKLFDFKPYNYGRFDAEIYRELDHLASDGLVTITPGGGGRHNYALTPQGYENWTEGSRLLFRSDKKIMFPKYRAGFVVCHLRRSLERYIVHTRKCVGDQFFIG